MTVKKCDICGAVCDSMSDMREVQIRKRKNIYDTKPVLEKSFDVCVNCVNKFIGRENMEGNKNED